MEPRVRRREIIETIEHEGRLYAQVIRADTAVQHTTFFSPAESSFQFGLLAHSAGFQEPAHYHKEFTREIADLQQMFVVQKGRVAVQIYSDERVMLEEITLGVGDAIVLMYGIHSLTVLEDMQCISVKQGPFLGTEFDKVEVKVKDV